MAVPQTMSGYPILPLHQPAAMASKRPRSQMPLTINLRASSAKGHDLVSLDAAQLEAQSVEVQEASGASSNSLTCAWGLLAVPQCVHAGAVVQESKQHCIMTVYMLRPRKVLLCH